jgi:beta-glucosidase
MEVKASDNPAYATFPNPVNQHPDDIIYSEGIFIGYRGYDEKGIQPLFPFGFGLSYTKFQFSNLSISGSYDGTTPVTVTFDVSNLGPVAGAEVAQLYIGEKNPPVQRPPRELKGFQKTVVLQPNQHQTIQLQLDQRSFAYWNINKEKWDAPKDTYNVYVGSSSQMTDLDLTGQVMVTKEITSKP